MADRYWVGGSANWDATAGTKWSTTDGGPGGASVPTSADNVFLTASSGASTVTITAATAACFNLNCTGFTGSLAGSTFGLDIYGGMTLSSTMSVPFVFGYNFRGASGSYNVDTAGKTLNAPCTFGFSSGITTTWTLQSAITTATNIGVTVSAGTFNTNNYNITAASFAFGVLSPVVNLGSSTITLNTAAAFSATAPATLNAGTSSIVLNYNLGGVTFAGGGFTYNNVSFTGILGVTHVITGANTYNVLSITGPSATGVNQVTFASSQTFTGGLATTGTAGNRRVWFRSATYGIANTFIVNGVSSSLTDADFRDIIVQGTAAPISGTRIGNLRGCSGITFDAPKTVYWNLAGVNSFSSNGWATTPSGTPATSNFPLAQDTATFTNAGAITEISFDSNVPYTGTIDMSGRTTLMSIAATSNAAYTIYGDLFLGTGPNFSGTNSNSPLVFSGRNTQTITLSSQTTPPITIDSYGGTVQLGSALSAGALTITVTNGTFTTNGYAVTASSLASNNSNVRTINLGASTVSCSGTVPIAFNTPTNLSFNAGTSQINATAASGGIVFQGGSQTFYNLSLTGTGAATHIFAGSNTYNNLTFSPSSAIGIMAVTIPGPQTINGTLTCTGSDAIHRIFLRSDTLGTTRTLTVNSLSANDCDFRDIAIAGAAAGTSPTRAGDCGGNSGITFPAPKTVYWNNYAASVWMTASWATTSGGSPSTNNFPLAQDTAVIDDASISAGNTILINAFCNIGSLDTSGRTSALTMNATTSSASMYGSLVTGSGVTYSGTQPIVLAGRGIQTITSAGKTLTWGLTVDSFSGTVQLADALTLTSTRTLLITSGTFDAVSYNVTTGIFANGTGTSTIKMGSGTWTLSGTAAVWNLNTSVSLYKGTANIVLSDTSTSARSFVGAGFSYNKLTIGGSTGTSTLTITGNNQFTELASTKTVAHTIALGTNNQTFGKWSVTGTVGNVVTITGTATLTIAGAAVSGVDYLALGTTVLSTTSPGEFWAGANSTGGTNFTLTAAPAPRTLYWVGGTGNWSSTTKWSTASGGASGAAIPTSLDSVVFNSASNATSYTATIDPTQARCASLTISGPASGSVTIAGAGGLALAGNTTIAASGVTRTYTGALTLSGAGSYTLTTNGVALASATEVNGISSTWTLGGAISNTAALTVTNGSFNTSNYSATLGAILSNNSNSRTITLGSSSIALSGFTTGINFSNSANLTFNSNTSSITMNNGNTTLQGGSNTFYNLVFAGSGNTTVVGSNTFNNLTTPAVSSAGIAVVSISANQTINGTLTLSAGTNATMRTMVQSDTLVTPRTLTCNAVAALQDIDFRDITIAGNAVSGGNLTGTRLGDCKGNTGITFPAAKTVYWRQGTAAWGSGGSGSWSFTNGGAADLTAFPLAQDTATFGSTYPPSTQQATINANYNIGTIDMSARTSNTMTLATSTTTPTIYGNWVNGTGVTLSGTGVLTFSGRGSQTITSAGVTFTQPITVNTPSGSATLQDAFNTSSTTSGSLTLTAGTFNANGYNVTLSGATSIGFSSTNTNTRTLAIGSGTWSIAGSGTAWTTTTSTNLTITGTGTINLTSASAKTFAGGGMSYSGITLNQGGAGALTLSGNNTFGNITNTYSATGATTINISATTQTVNNWAATGASGKVLTVQGTSAASPGTLILNGGGTVSGVDYTTISNVRAYPITNTWYVGNNSTNSGSLGFIFGAGPIIITGTVNETTTLSDLQSVIAALVGDVSETETLTDTNDAGAQYPVSQTEATTLSDTETASQGFNAARSENITLTDTRTAVAAFASAISEAITVTNTQNVTGVFVGAVSETQTITDTQDAMFIILLVCNEALTLSDTQNRVYAAGGMVNETTTLNAAQSAIASLVATISESTTLTEEQIAQAVFVAVNTESLGLTAAQDVTANFSGVQNETVALTDDQTSNAAFIGSQTESITVADFQAALAQFASSIDEAITLTSEEQGGFLIFVNNDESVTLTSLEEVQAALTGNVIAPIQLTDKNEVISALVGHTAEFMSILETQYARGWYKINDGQTPNWTLINDAQSTTWTIVDTSQDAGWTPVVDGQ